MMTTSVVALLTALSSIARADMDAARWDEDDAPHVAVAIDRRDTPPHDLWDGSSGLWVALEGQLVDRASGERSIGAMLLVGVPLDRLAKPRFVGTLGRSGVAQDARPTLKPARGAKQTPPPAAAAEAPPPPPPPDSIEKPLEIPVAVTPTVARAAVRAAWRAARLVDPDARIDAIASRARSSALLPELRLRATRLVDEDESLAPTQYDPGRTTASGGTSMWLEARATWRLDRLVFADDEVALERMRYDRAEAQARLSARVLELLFAWQRARALEADAGRTPEEHLNATLQVLEAEAALDVVTGGWFLSWRERTGRKPRAAEAARP